MVRELEEMLPRLRDSQEEIDRTLGPLRTLDPARTRTTPLVEICREILSGEEDRQTITLFCEGAIELAHSQAVNFPENIFWDLDLLLAEVYRDSQRGDSTVDHSGLRERFVVLDEILGLYGRRSSVNFNYVHDFIYGYDWVKWVSRDERERQDSSPFNLEFLRHLEKRGQEIVALIRKNDDFYQQLPRSTPRNVFGFSRDPDDEVKLFGHLASSGHIPVEAWNVNGTRRPDFNLYQVRYNTALELGLGRD